MSHEHVSNTKRIWMVFGILSVVTKVEVFGRLAPAPAPIRSEALFVVALGYISKIGVLF